MSLHMVIVNGGFSKAVREFDSEEAARSFAELHTRAHGVPCHVVKLVDTCSPRPREIQWDEQHGEGAHDRR